MEKLSLGKHKEKRGSEWSTNRQDSNILTYLEEIGRGFSEWD